MSRGRSATPIESTLHKDRRANIPTNELRDFIEADENAPKKVLYPRDPSLDPQLIWKGKDEQDQRPLEVPAAPIYIQEKIHPHALIEDLRAQTQRDEYQQLDLYASDFGEMDLADLVEFYQHEQNWANRLILGDSLLVMTSLAEKEGLKGKVQMIYLDPPYGIRFGSNWQVSTRKKEVKDGKVEDLTRQPEQIKAFRDTWELGIHSYLTYLRDRLTVARELLTENGSIFVQIGDENVHLVRCVLDEVFGAENFVVLITFQKSGATTSELLSNPADYILWYAKHRPAMKYRQLYAAKNPGGPGASKYTAIELPDGQRLSLSSVDDDFENVKGRLFRLDAITSQGYRVNTSVPFGFRNRVYETGISKNWKTTLDGMQRLAKAGRIEPSSASLNYVRFIDDFPAFPLTSIWTDVGGIQSRADPKIYVVQTATTAVQRCILMATDPGDLVLDPTCGSGTTAYVAEQWGRRWITIDTSRVALALARTRLMAAKYPYYLLADSPEGIAKEAEITGQLPTTQPAKTEYDVKKGFVYKRVPHVTLKSIANNEEIDAVHAKWREELEPVRAELNQLLSKAWEEWELSREPDKAWPQQAKDLLAKWWESRLARQKEIDASIARRADTEILYDQPYEDKKRIRVAGPFTVESLSPHRVLSTDEELPESAAEAQKEASIGQFEAMILDNLKKAGVQNTVKDERLKFDWLEPYAGQWLHAEGEYTEKDGTTRKVAVCIGPEHGTVGPDWVKNAAKEAVRGVGFDLLIICGFAFDSHVPEEAKRYGKLPVLITRMNPDLAMGDELLKKTGAGNLFMVFGEPDVGIRKKDGRIVVKINGVDVYDPTTGQIRSASTDDIACWFIDTNYNEEAFFVRHAYFTGADRPYENLQKALRAEIDEAAWSALYSTESRPFTPPKTGRIAVKVINHYGDEVLKVYAV